jgi:hypothetical protein
LVDLNSSIESLQKGKSSSLLIACSLISHWRKQNPQNSRALLVAPADVDSCAYPSRKTSPFPIKLDFPTVVITSSMILIFQLKAEFLRKNGKYFYKYGERPSEFRVKKNTVKDKKFCNRYWNLEKMKFKSI